MMKLQPRHTNRRPLALLVLGSLFGLTACNLPNDSVTRAAALASGDLSNGEILQVLRVLNTGEIRQAELANQRSGNRSIQNAARQILDDHTSSNQRIDEMVEAGYNLNQSPLSRGMEVQAEQIRENIEELNGVAFDCAFLDAQIEQHELALETIRTELEPDAEDQNVTALLADTVPALEGHLAAARDARTSMNRCPGS